MRQRIQLIVIAALMVLAGSLYREVNAQRVGDCLGCVPWSGMIRGRVVNAQGRGMSKITVHALSHNQEKGLILSAKTNRNGFFLFFVPHGRYTLYAGNESLGYPEDYGGIYLDAVMFSEIAVAKDKVTRVLLTLGRRLRTLSGRIVDSSTGGYVKDANFSISLVENPTRYLETAPDLRGRFSVLSPPAQFMLRVQAPGYETKEIFLEPNSSKTILVPLTPLATAQTSRKRH
ncbi:MAG: carboxypeptidase-like regulatory domain-containing protein [Acidobacteriota bacterium]